MSTLEPERSVNPALRTAFADLCFSILLALFGMVYEGFSHGVYSFYMIYAFLFLLGGGALPFLVVGLQKNSRSINPSAKALYHCGLATLTIGSILQGVLEIYGTTNGLIRIYWIAGLPLAIVGAVLCVLLRDSAAR